MSNISYYSNEVQVQEPRMSRSRSRSRSNSPKSPPYLSDSYSSSSSSSRSRSSSRSLSPAPMNKNNNENIVSSNNNNNSIQSLVNGIHSEINGNGSTSEHTNGRDSTLVNPVVVNNLPTTTTTTTITNSGHHTTSSSGSSSHRHSSSSSKNTSTSSSSGSSKRKPSSSSSSSSSSKSKSIDNLLFSGRKSSSSSSKSSSSRDYSSSGNKKSSSSSSSSSPSLNRIRKSMSQKDRDQIMSLLREDSDSETYPLPPIPPPNFNLGASTSSPKPQPLPLPLPLSIQPPPSIFTNGNTTTSNNNNNYYNGNNSIFADEQLPKTVQPLDLQSIDSEEEITDEYYKKMLKSHKDDKSTNRKAYEQKFFDNIILSSDGGEEFESDDQLVKKRNKLMDKIVMEMGDNKREHVKCRIKKKKMETTRDRTRDSVVISTIRRQLNEQLNQLNQSRKRRSGYSSSSSGKMNIDSLSGSDDEVFNKYLSGHSRSSRSHGRSSHKSRSSRSSSRHETALDRRKQKNYLKSHGSSQISNKIDLQAPPLSSDDDEIDIMLLDRKKLTSSGSTRSGRSKSSTTPYEPKNLQTTYGCSEDLDPSFQSKWAQIVRKEMPRGHRKLNELRSHGLHKCRKMANSMKNEVKRRYINKLQAQKPVRDVQARSRRLVKEMAAYWRKYEKDEREAKKRADKEETLQRKREEESREAKRQQRKLNFLITQTELYSHFMSKKLTGGANVASGTGKEQPPLPAMPNESGDQSKPLTEQLSDEESDEDVDELTEQEKAEEEQLRLQAIKNSEKAVQQQLMKTKAFDDDIHKIRSDQMKEQGEGENENENENETIPNSNLDSTEEMDFGGTLIPTGFPGGDSALKQPTILNAQLKSYQLKGMSWIVNLYDQGINGILADEMGLGKTIQSIAVLANLAEEKGIWGPFLIVTPKSTLHNWYQEFKRFVPQFKVLPYWGSQKQRETLRKYWNVKKLYQKNSPFHVLITSYNVIVLDEKYFHRIRWQYMVLDEAHSIKSSASNRWKTLMSFNCRNRLLLTGTPIQNNMAELWALLHFIMPTLFDSHDEFAEWFSKDIENHANQGGGGLNEHQLNRLHLILKPFMLRRMKKDVENEMPPKYEIEVMCSLTIRQKKLYQNIRSEITISELLGNTFSATSMKNLVNLVMQFRKVCNHPETFERSQCKAPLLFQDPSYKEPIDRTLPQCPNHLKVMTAYPSNPIIYHLPKQIYLSTLWHDTVTTPDQAIFQSNLEKLSIWSVNHINDSLRSGCQGEIPSSTFSFSRFINLSPQELSKYARDYSMIDLFIEHQSIKDELYDVMNYSFNEYKSEKELSTNLRYMLLEPTITNFTQNISKIHTLDELILSPYDRYNNQISMIQSTYAICPKATTPSIELDVSNQSFARKDFNTRNNTSVSKLLYDGISDSMNQIQLTEFSENTSESYLEDLQIKSGLMGGLYNVFGSSQIWVPSFNKSLNDSGKLQVLDKLLKKLKAEGHRVLIYSQFTKMINILEDFMIFRKYKFLRLDGSYKLEDRRDMVDDFQTDPSIFAFLLSTRACGIGINLTAADTVIFYDSDWNPTVDEQAMDRCHRLGQVRPVTVYRLITKGTIEEKIIKRAKQKHQIQSIVIAGGKFENNTADSTDENSPENMKEVVSFLLEDEEVEEKLKQYQMNNSKKRKLEENSIQDKPFNPSDIPASKVMKGRPPSKPKIETVDPNIPKPPPKKKGPKPGTKRTKTTDASNILINPQTGETYPEPQNGDINMTIVQPPQPPPAKGKKKGAPRGKKPAQATY